MIGEVAQATMDGPVVVAALLGYQPGITEFGVFALHFAVAAVLTMLVMDRVGSGSLRSGFLLGVVGAVFVLVAEFVFGPMVIVLSVSQFKAVVIAAATGTAVAVSLVVVLVRPQEGSGRGIGVHGSEAVADSDTEIEL